MRSYSKISQHFTRMDRERSPPRSKEPSSSPRTEPGESSP
jgi:hypothetical protein